MGAYRLSLSWPRIQPTGRGAVNAKGLDYYNRVIDGLLEAGIEPAVTLYHWDLPQALQDAGGWANRDIADWFGEFAAIAGEAFGDRVTKWITLNEPWVVAHVGYRDGRHAPGIRDAAQAVAANHHLLLAHGQRGRRAARRAPVPPATGRASRSTWRWSGRSRRRPPAHAAVLEARQNGVYLDPIFRGRLPGAARRRRVLLPRRRPASCGTATSALIGAPLDFLGVNFYAPHYVGCCSPDGEPRRGETVTGPGTVSRAARRAADHRDELAGRAGLHPRAADPGGRPGDRRAAGLHHGERVVLARLRHPGRPGRTTTSGSSYLRGHLAAVHGAIADGVPVRGYFAWSLLDNFEWAEGYAKRFGLAFVDFGTQQRILKRSGEFYASVTRANALRRSENSNSSARTGRGFTRQPPERVARDAGADGQHPGRDLVAEAVLEVGADGVIVDVGGAHRRAIAVRRSTERAIDPRLLSSRTTLTSTQTTRRMRLRRPPRPCPRRASAPATPVLATQSREDTDVGWGELRRARRRRRLLRDRRPPHWDNAWLQDVPTRTMPVAQRLPASLGSRRGRRAGPARRRSRRRGRWRR